MPRRPERSPDDIDTLDKLLARAEEISSDAERVTHAHLRKVTLPGGAGALGLITLDNGEDHTKPNTFGPRGLLSLNAAIDAALADDEVTALGVTGKPFILAAGADLTSIAGGGPDGVRIVAELGHAVFRKLGEGGKPSFGFVNGLALGGGLEVALHCTYRTVCDSAPALGLPEVMLGLVPGWGGAWLVPNLVGAEAAVKLILENPLNNGKTLKGADAYAFGLADAVFEGADFLEQSLLWAAAVLSGEITVDRARPDRGEAWDAAVAKGRVDRRGEDRRRLPRRDPRARPDRGRQGVLARRGLRGRGPGAGRPRADARSCSPRSTRSTWCRSAPSVRPAHRTGRWPARSARSASSAPA